MPLCHSRIKTFGDFMDLFEFMFINHLKYNDEMFAKKGLTKTQACYILQAMIWLLEESNDWTAQGVQKASKDAAEILGINHKKTVMPVLFASLMGKSQGPPLFNSAEILGKDVVRARLLKAIQYLEGISNKKMQAFKKEWEKEGAKDVFAEGK